MKMNGNPSGSHSSFLGGTVSNDKACRPLCGQTQAFWSADKRNGGGAVENRTA